MYFQLQRGRGLPAILCPEYFTRWELVIELLKKDKVGVLGTTVNRRQFNGCATDSKLDRQKKLGADQGYKLSTAGWVEHRKQYRQRSQQYTQDRPCTQSLREVLMPFSLVEQKLTSYSCTESNCHFSRTKINQSYKEASVLLDLPCS